MKAKTALVTGGIGGIGTAICRRLSSDAFDVITVYHPMEDERAEVWRAEQSADGYDIETLAMDVASPDACSITLTRLLEDRGPIEVTVSPGYVSTAMTEAIREDIRETIVAGIPMGRMAASEEIAGAIAYLVEEEAGYITGANLPVNGGLYMS